MAPATTAARTVASAALGSFPRISRTTVPSPRGKFQTPADFLNTIGRGCEKYASKFKDWDHLFLATSDTMKSDMGISPRQRKWILNWTHKYRLGVDPYYIPPSKKGTTK